MPIARLLLPSGTLACAVSALVLAMTPTLRAQLPAAPMPVELAGNAAPALPGLSSGSAASDSKLPQAPAPAVSAPAETLAYPGDTTAAGKSYPRAARATDITILPGQIAPRQTVRDKLIGSIRDSYSPFSIGGEVISAGYSHLTNGSPNYGSDGNAFAQRFGAAVARGTSQNLFAEGAMAAILHEDPRYYQLGSSKPFLKRVVYAATRPLITRTDSGKATPNLALLSGYLGAAALTKVYYPPLNQGFGETLITYGGSIGGAAIGDEVSEFLSDTLTFLHLKRHN